MGGGRRVRGGRAHRRAPAHRGRAPRLRALRAQLPALLALQEPDRLPCHGAVVHRHGAPRPPPPRARRDRARALGPAVGPRTDHQHDRHAPGLVRVPPARLGRAGRRALLRAVRRAARERGALRARGGHLRTRGLRRVVPACRGGARPARNPLRGVRRRDLSPRRRHPRRLVRLGSELAVGSRAASPARSRRRVPRGQRPASRLVPQRAPDGRGGRRESAVRHRRDPRLHPRRHRPEDVEVARQRHRARGRHPPPRSRAATPVGGGRGLPRGRARLRGDPGAARRGVPADPQYRALSPRKPLRLRPRARCRAVRPAARPRALGAAPDPRPRRALPRGLRRV